MALEGIVRILDAFFRHWDDAEKMWSEHERGGSSRAARAVRAADAQLAKARTEAKSTGPVSSAQSSAPPMTISDATAQRISEEQCILRRQDDLGALQRALPELVSLDRYERRALSRRNRAIRMFEAITIVAPFLNRETKGR